MNGAYHAVFKLNTELPTYLACLVVTPSQEQITESIDVLLPSIPRTDQELEAIKSRCKYIVIVYWLGTEATWDIRHIINCEQIANLAHDATQQVILFEWIHREHHVQATIEKFALQAIQSSDQKAPKRPRRITSIRLSAANINFPW